ncbi:MAG: ribosomal-processing cysteine protease Prp [Lachnospiraceae bacterium]|nr:ribosomal-processing cysteine protease Prp [Lachnospiraceae bacterium]
MIKARFEYTEDNKSFLLTVKDHAGQAEAGKDIICASASILAYTVAQIVTDLHQEGKLKKRPTVKLNAGDAVITCKPRKDAYAEALHAFFVAQVGFNLLAHNYPNYVQLTPFGKDN